MKLVYQHKAIFLNFSPTSNHLYPLQVENCDSNSRLVVDEDDNVNSGLKGLKGDIGVLFGSMLIIRPTQMNVVLMLVQPLRH